MSATPTARLLVSTSAGHDLRDDVAVIDFACDHLPAVAKLERLIFHGGNFVPSYSAWRTRGTRKLLRAAPIARVDSIERRRLVRAG